MAPYVPDVIPESDRQYFRTETDPETRTGWGGRPAVLVVDMTVAFTSERPEVGTPCVEANADLLATARDAGVPVVFTTPTGPGTFPETYRKPAKGSQELPSDLSRREWVANLDEIVPALEPDEDELVLERPRASAFFDTHLANTLHYYDVDTLVVTGMTTSGCVRATVVDGYASNFRIVVPPACVADRSVVSHEVSLFDMDMKYADVTPLEAVRERLRSVADRSDGVSGTAFSRADTEQ